jgi:TetR/AcrR family transcriptional repressor of nem operon
MGRRSQARERLMNTALELLWQRSYGAVSVEDICAQATVNKGSFYYFFPSKAALACAAYDAYWEGAAHALADAFAPAVQPLKRLDRYCALICEGQKLAWDKTGHVLGCPIACAAAEMSTTEETIRRKAVEIFEQMNQHLEATLREAFIQGRIPRQDFGVTSRLIQAYLTGMLLQAKARNDIAPLRWMRLGVLRLAGAPANGRSVKMAQSRAGNEQKLP